jgi:hypothetical protein
MLFTAEENFTNFFKILILVKFLHKKFYIRSFIVRLCGRKDNASGGSQTWYRKGKYTGTSSIFFI